MKITLSGVACGYGRDIILENIHITAQTGEILCILGPNGVGKTTLFKSLLGFLPLLQGAVYFDGKDAKLLSKKECAQFIAYVPQGHTSSFGFQVMDVILMGRTAHLGFFSQPDARDLAVVNTIIEGLGIEKLRNRVFTQLSGGERQMVLIARALAQEPSFLLMDEPTSNLDFGNQAIVLDRIIKLSQKHLGVIMTTHSPEQVLMLNAKVVLIKRDKSVAFGSANAIVTEQNLRDTYGIPVAVMHVPYKDRFLPVCQPIMNEER